MATGQLEHLLGARASNVDKLMRRLNFKRVAQETLQILAEEDRAILQAYADGINDYISNIGYFRSEISAFYLPPEFWAHNVTTASKFAALSDDQKQTWKALRPWQVEDTLAIMRLHSFKLSSASWTRQVWRDKLSADKVASSEEIEAMMSELMNVDELHDVQVLEDDDALGAI